VKSAVFVLLALVTGTAAVLTVSTPAMAEKECRPFVMCYEAGERHAKPDVPADIMKRITDVIHNMGVDKKVTENASLCKDLDMDNLDQIELNTSLEEEFGRLIKSEDFDKFKTVGDIARYFRTGIIPSGTASECPDYQLKFQNKTVVTKRRAGSP
jgi:acyl carrier protein